MSITKITTPELLDFPNDSTSSANTSGTVIPKGYTALCTFPGSNANVALYTMDGNADDSCGSLNLTNNNSVTFTANSPWGGSYQSADFDGSNYLSYGVGLGASADRTRSLWINIDTIPGGFCTLIYIGDAGANENYEVLSLQSSGKVRFQGRYGATTTSEIETGSALSTSTWYHIAWVYEGSSQLLYLNGVLVNTCGNTGGSGTSNSVCPSVTNTLTAGITHIAAWRDGSTVYDGKIAQVRFYNQALNGDQIAELYNENLTTYYRPTTSLNAGEFRYNEQLGYVEYYDGSTWLQIADEYISDQPTTCICNYPITSTALYQFNDNLINTCGSPTGAGTDITYGTGQFNNAVDFNGSTSRIVLGNQTWFNAGDYSVSFWMRNEGNDSDYQMIVSQRTSSDAGSPINISMYGVSYGSNNGMLYFNVGGSYFVSNTALSKDTWYHLVFTIVAGGNMNIYINNVLDSNSTTESTTRPTPTTQNLSIGANGGTFEYPFNGKIDQFRVFNSALTSTQVSELYNEVVCN
tara:strand:- start:38 stop:1600 length:1563 start_codon:yes stop_codon:yes gene_type:complete